MQETLLLVRDHAGRFAVRSGNGDDDARRWILGVAANASRQIMRRHGRQLQRDRHAGRMAAQVAPPIVDPSQRAENIDQSMLLRRELAELPDVYGQVLTLHYFGGQDYSMLATDLRVSIHTVRSRVHRGLKALRERLERCGVTLSIAGLTGLLSHLGAASTVGGAATVSATTLGLISSTAAPTTSFSAVSSGMSMATVLASAFAALFAVVVLSGVYLSSFSADSTPPEKVEVREAARAAGTAGAAGTAIVVNNARVTPFILVVKTDQMNEKTASVAVQEVRDRWPDMIHLEGPFLTSGPDQFRLPLHLFAHYDFTIKWGDGTTQVVRSDAPVDQAIIDEAWLAQVKNGLEQPLTLDFDRIPHNDDNLFRIKEKESRTVKGLRYLLKEAGIDLCGQIFIDPKVSNNELEEVRGFRVQAMKLSDIFEHLSEVTGLTYVLHDRALVIAKRQNLPRFTCPLHTYAQPGTYTIEIIENVKGGFPQIYFNGCYENSFGADDDPKIRFNNDGYDCVKVMDLAQWGGNTWMNMQGAFSGCVNMTISASDAVTALTGEVKNFKKAWLGCLGLTSFSLLNTAAVTELSEAWKGCVGLTNFPLLNTAAGTNFQEAWEECAGLTSFPLLNTAAATNFQEAWKGCAGLTSFPFLRTALVTNFYSAWAICSSLTSFPLLDTAAGTNFIAPWSGCSGLTSFPLLDTSAGTDFSGAWSGCRGLTSFPLLDTSAGTIFFAAWSDCRGLTNFPLLDTSAAKNFNGAWSDCRGLTSFPLLDTSAGTNFGYAWSGCFGLTNFPLLNTSAGTEFADTWRDCRGLTNFPQLNLGKMEQAEGCFFGVSLTPASYDELLNKIMALNKVSNVKFDSGFSKAHGLIGVQAREKLIKELGWTIIDGDSRKPAPKNARPAELQPQPEAVNEF